MITISDINEVLLSAREMLHDSLGDSCQSHILHHKKKKLDKRGQANQLQVQVGRDLVRPACLLSLALDFRSTGVINLEMVETMHGRLSMLQRAAPPLDSSLHRHKTPYTRDQCTLSN